MPLVASLASLVAAMRARVLDRGACGPLADRRRAAAAARRELAGHLLVAAPVWRNEWMSRMIHHQGCCLLELRPGHHEHLLRDVPGPAQLALHARARRQGQLCGMVCSPMLSLIHISEPTRLLTCADGRVSG